MAIRRKRDRIKNLAKGLLSRRASGTGGRTRVEPKPVTVVFEGHPAKDVHTGQTLLQAAIRMGIDLPHYCGGHCSCGSCMVSVLKGADNLSSPQGREGMLLGPGRTKQAKRLACQSIIQGPVTIRISDHFFGN